MMKWMRCFHLIVPYAVFSDSAALFLECVHLRLNWTEKGVPTSVIITLRYNSVEWSLVLFIHIGVIHGK